MLEEVMKRPTIHSLKYLLDNIVLEDFQTVDALTAVIKKKCILGHDTGLGKTIVASAIMKMLINQNDKRRFLFICKRNQFAQTPSKISYATGLSVLPISSEQASLKENLYSLKLLEYNIVILAEEVLNIDDANAILLSIRHYFSGIFVDEIHTMCNYNESSRARIIKGMFQYYEYAYGMTATPMTSDLKQWALILSMVNREEFANWKYTLSDLEHQRIDIETEYPGTYIRRTRRDLGIPNVYTNHIHFVEPLEHQRKASGFEMFNICKARDAYPQVNKLIEILQSIPKEDKGLVYIRFHETRKFVSEQLNKAGINHECINGKTSFKKRKDIMDRYNRGELNLIITSTTSSLDLNGDFVILYEFTCELRQILGRLERGLNPKEIQVHYILTLDTAEPLYFIERIYNRSLILQNILRRDYKMILDVGKTIKDNYDISDLV